MSQVMEPTLLQCFVKRSMHNIIWSFMIYMVNNKHNLDKVRLLKAYVARDGLRKYRNHQFRCHRISSYLFIHRTFFYFFYFFIFIFYRHYRQYWTITQQDKIYWQIIKYPRNLIITSLKETSTYICINTTCHQAIVYSMQGPSWS
jgi:hypothetical protein